MSDNYQAIYDAVAQRVGRPDIERVAREVMWQHFDIGLAKQLLSQAIDIVQSEHTRPSVLYRPSIAPDGNQWSALYGDNIQEGVAGFGDTPAAAMAAFDKAWLSERCGIRVVAET